MTNQQHSLDTVVAEMNAGIEKLAAAFRAKHHAKPEQYPLVLGEDIAGLWLEFSVSFCESGEV